MAPAADRVIGSLPATQACPAGALTQRGVHLGAATSLARCIRATGRPDELSWREDVAERGHVTHVPPISLLTISPTPPPPPRRSHK
jgi:hypothetical protein